MYSCPLRCQADKVCTSSCLAAGENRYTLKCDRCFASHALCVNEKCPKACGKGKTKDWSPADGIHKPMCMACVFENCEENFKLCTGFKESLEKRELDFDAPDRCDTDDKNTWLHRGQSLMIEQLNKCGRNCWGEIDCVSTCVRQYEGYSKNCATCFGDVVGCTRRKCLSKCIWGMTQDCIDCTKTYCVAGFTKCTGGWISVTPTRGDPYFNRYKIELEETPVIS